MLFSLPRGKARILAARNGQGWFVVHHAETVAGDAASSPGLIEATRGQFERILGEEYAAQFTRAVEAQIEVERNDKAIRELREQLQRGGNVQ
jgi:peptidyl-prolyl cis-trans isomerase D